MPKGSDLNPRIAYNGLPPFIQSDVYYNIINSVILQNWAKGKVAFTIHTLRKLFSNQYFILFLFLGIT